MLQVNDQSTLLVCQIMLQWTDGRLCCHARGRLVRYCQCDNMRTLWLVTYMSVRAIQPASPTIGHHLAKPQQTLLDPYFMRACMGIMNLWFRTDVYGQYTDNIRTIYGHFQQAGVEVLPCTKGSALLL